MIDYFKEILPEKIIEQAFLLESIGVKDLSWKKDDALLVIEYLIQNKKIILGGDVYKVENYQLSATCDSWFYQINLINNLTTSTVESAHIAREYIENYFSANGNSFCYSIII